MSHELTVREDGSVEFAFIGSRDAIWHGLGNELPENASIEEWKKVAGLDWTVERSDVFFDYTNDQGYQVVPFPGKKVLYRSDTKAPLSVMGESFKIVQPGEVLEFFRDLVALNGMKLSTAGTLFGGKKFWALAEVGKETKINGNDEVRGNLLLTTSVDGTQSTTAQFVSTRVVCNNTLNVALREGGKVIRKTHHAEFDAKSVKIDMGVLDDSWVVFINKINKLAETPMADQQVNEFFKKLVFDPKLSEEDQKWGATRRLDRLLSLYNEGAGADMAKGTAWGALNAVTNMYTHGTGRRDQSAQFADSFTGASSDMKDRAMEELLALA